MALPLPASLSPSRLTSFRDCGLAFRLANIDKLPDPPGPPAVQGTLVHRALELLHLRPGPQRTPEAAEQDLGTAWDEIRTTEDFIGLGLDEAAARSMHERAAELIERSFQLEDHRQVNSIGLELKLEAEIGGARVRGIIDRLDLEGDELVVVDYKTGRAPSDRFTGPKMLGVHVYAALVEAFCGQRPREVRLHHLAEPVIITATPTDQHVRGLHTKVGAMWQAIERACETEAFQPRPGRLCDWCAFRAYCPAQGGDLEAAWRISAANTADAGALTTSSV